MRRRIRGSVVTLRLAVTLAFVLIAAAVVGASFWIGDASLESRWENILVNLGTEIVGIVITVAVVEWFFDRRRLQERARQLAWGALHAVEHAVWVWQGGPREVETDELLAILHGVGASDPFPEFTQNLMLNIGMRSREALNNDPDAVLALPGLAEALENLMRLSRIRDGSVPPPEKVAGVLEEGVAHLARVLGLPTERLLARLIRYRDPQAESQEQRYYGVMLQQSQGLRPFRAAADDHF